MKLKTGSEQLQMSDIPEMASPDDVAAYLSDLATMPHDYNTSAMAPAYAAIAAFNYVAREVGLSGFQAGYATLEMTGALMGIDRPYGIIKGEDLLYPQYGSLTSKVAEWERDWLPVISEKARRLLAENPPDAVLEWTDDDGQKHSAPKVHPSVRAHWERLAARP